MDPIINCIIGACCPPEVREKALAQYLAQTSNISDAEAARTAKVILEAFDLAPKGTLLPLIQEVARLARGEGYKG